MSFTLFVVLMLSIAFGFSTPLSTNPKSACSTTAIQLTVPAGQTVLTQPTTTPSFVFLGVGVQNYTCSSASTYVFVSLVSVHRMWIDSSYRTDGAVAELFDISCLTKSPYLFNNSQDLAYTIWSRAPALPVLKSLPVGDFLNLCNGLSVGEHYFTPVGTGMAPIWDLRRTNPSAFVVGAKVGDLKAPTGPNDVDWLQLNGVPLNGVQGKLAIQVWLWMWFLKNVVIWRASRFIEQIPGAECHLLL